MLLIMSINPQDKILFLKLLVDDIDIGITYWQSGTWLKEMFQLGNFFIQFNLVCPQECERSLIRKQIKKLINETNWFTWFLY